MTLGDGPPWGAWSVERRTGRGGLRAARARPAENQAHTPATTSPPRQASTANPALALAIGPSRYKLQCVASGTLDLPVRGARIGMFCDGWLAGLLMCIDRRAGVHGGRPRVRDSGCLACAVVWTGLFTSLAATSCPGA